MAESDEKHTSIRDCIKSYPDFPKPGVVFRDIFSVLSNPSAFKELHNRCIQHARSITPAIETVVALDARGFLFGPLLALTLDVPFIPIRKKGKLPGEVHSIEYNLEYGKDALEIQKDSIKKGARVLVVDDLLATGGSLAAACKLLQVAEVEVAECLVIIELKYLHGRSKIPAKVHSFFEYEM